MRGLADFKRSTAPSNGMNAKRSAGVPLSSPAAAQRGAEGAGLDSGAPDAAQSAMPSIALLCSITDRRPLSTKAAVPMAPQLQSRNSTSLTDVTRAREKYRIVCEVIEHNLISWGAIFDMRLTHGTITVPLPAHSSVWAMKPPFHKTFKGCPFVVPPIWRHRLSKRPRSGCDHLGSDFNFFALFRFAMRGAHGAPASRRPVGPTLHLVLPMSTV